jgi:hypothetical protein
MYNGGLMKITQCTRDHREHFTSKELRKCETFAGERCIAEEWGIDDQYTQFYFSKDVSEEIIDWVIGNRYCIWHLVQDITFNDLEDLIAQINAYGAEWGGDCWEELSKESKDEGGFFE